MGIPVSPEPGDVTGMLQYGLLNLAALFPLELYFIPRWLLATDSFSEGSPNPKEEWKLLFEERWGRVFLARVMVTLAATIGFFLCFIPGIVILIYFGWTSWRVLLQGETITVAAKTCAKTMALLWPQVSFAVAVIILIVLLGNDLAALAASGLEDEISWHLLNVFGQFTIVWMNAALLALYQWMETAAARVKMGWRGS
jgi:hypothetical protein